MDIKEFQKISVRTMNTNLDHTAIISNCIAGIFGEGGEVADILKKHLYQYHPLDIEHVKEEIGDLMFYIVNLVTILNLDMEDILEANINKLMERYPDGFDVTRSINR